MDDLESSLAHIRGAWMAGRSAFQHCPPEWRAAVEGVGAECALAALAGHAGAVLFRPAPAAALEPRRLLPELAPPTLPEPLRPHLRRLMAKQKGGASIERHWIDFVAARGYVLHPADWLPASRADWAPDGYAPWFDWVRGEDKPFPPPTFALDTYEQWSWAMRCAALVALRTRDPGAARAIIAAKASSEVAERRAMLIEILDTGLSDQDVECLEAQADDRSERVQVLARLYLARLGRRVDAEALATELADMLEVRKSEAPGGRASLAIDALKTPAQNARRRDLFKLVSLAGLARALRITEEEIVETAPVGAPDGVEAFVQMVAATGSDRACRMLLDQMLDDGAFPLAHARSLGPRLDAEQRRALQPRILMRDAEMFETTLTLMGRVLGEAALPALLASPGYAALTNAVEAARGEDETQRRPADALLETMLSRIAFLADAPAAAALLARLTAAGLPAADPRLDPLRFNAALTTEATP
ncbi:DUF5691 domain-containing protein [Methylocapsa sp. S129]|uniref:DUF5691 domain-containing protein n=1 Tax=Methylocapsa sp. S129 TaxID=1641869 RepID=UPI00131C7432|nr:DUF5691 domain-containing protein [Methylocapsa sp. S129]